MSGWFFVGRESKNKERPWQRQDSSLMGSWKLCWLIMHPACTTPCHSSRILFSWTLKNWLRFIYVVVLLKIWALDIVMFNIELKNVNRIILSMNGYLVFPSFLSLAFEQKIHPHLHRYLFHKNCVSLAGSDCSKYRPLPPLLHHRLCPRFWLSLSIRANLEFSLAILSTIRPKNRDIYHQLINTRTIPNFHKPVPRKWSTKNETNSFLLMFVVPLLSSSVLISAWR